MSVPRGLNLKRAARSCAAVDDLESVVVEARVDFDVCNGFLHGQHIADIRDRIERIERIIANALAQNFFSVSCEG